MTIRTRLLATYVALTALGMSLLAGYILWSFRAYYVRSTQADLMARTTALSETVADALQRGDLSRVRVIVRRHGTQDGLNLRVFGPDGRLLETSVPDDRSVPDWDGLPGLAAGLEGRSNGGIAPGIHSRHDRVYEVRPIRRGGRMLGVLRVSFGLDRFEREFTGIFRNVLLALMLSFTVCALISVWLARSLALPIQEMRNFAVQIGGGSFGGKLSVRRKDELGELAIELNRMSERLASLDDERRAFLANVSHELRTPVSNVQVTLEALESGAAEDPELRGRFFRTLQDETRRLSRLIQDLLELGRLEAGVVPIAREVVLLDRLTERALRAMEPRARAASVALTADVQRLQVRGEEERLLQVLLNLLDNAIKFSTPGTTVAILGTAEGGTAVLQVRDQGAGIRAADLPRIFEQFYTADPARRRGGAGLGLAIARRVVEAHGGTITAASAEGQGALFAVRLPLDSAAEPLPAAASETSPSLN